MTSSPAKGSCLCGAITVTANTAAKDHVGACHCTTCRKWAGGPLMAIDCATEVTFTGEDNISVYSSSEWADRGFCKNCGTHLFYRLKEAQKYFMSVGIFETNTEFTFDHQVFIDEKPAFYAFANKTKDMTGAEVFALFGASQD